LLADFAQARGVTVRPPIPIDDIVVKHLNRQGRAPHLAAYLIRSDGGDRFAIADRISIPPSPLQIRSKMLAAVCSHLARAAAGHSVSGSGRVLTQIMHEDNNFAATVA
jgi:hypothetical protein